MESPQTVRMASKIGNRRFLHSTGLGKVLLSCKTEKEIVRLLRIRGTPRLTHKTIIDREGILCELESVRARGYAWDDQENEIEGRCVAAEMTAPDGTLVAVVSISGSGSEFRMSVAGSRT